MATVVPVFLEGERPDSLSGTPRAYAIDRWIYVFTAASFVAITLAGFIPDSLHKIAAVNSGARPPLPLVMHVHAVLMGSYLLLLLTQTWLAATGKLSWHMQLGALVFAIVPAIMVAGFVLARTVYLEFWQTAQMAAPGIRKGLEVVLSRKENVLLAQMRQGLLFPLFLSIGLLARRTDAGLHKRMMMLATVVVLPAAIDRILWLPNTFPQSYMATEAYTLLAISPMFVWDTIRNGVVHRAYLIWLSISLPFAIALHALWDTPSWHVIARQLIGP